MKNINFNYLFLPLLFLVSPVWADSNFAITDFEMLNLTLQLSDPQKVAKINAQDQKNIKILNTLIREGIADTEGFNMIQVSAKDRSEADKGIGYLFDCAKCSANLGREYNADYILIGRLHKPTYLFSYIIIRIFDVKTNRLLKEYRAEIKGEPSVTMPGAIENILVNIRKDVPR